MLASKIREVAIERTIRTLVHFTQAANLPSILRHGLHPLAWARAIGLEPVTNDSLRLDGQTDASSVSIEFPNDKMFFKYRRKIKNADWVVLKISPSVLWTKRCVYCRRNAADGRMTGVSLRGREGPQGLLGMFEELANTPRRDQANLLPGDPTDVQAEVLIFDIVEPALIRAVVFESVTLRDKFKWALGARRAIVVGSGKGYFAPRSSVRAGPPMAQRPVFQPVLEGPGFVKTTYVEFQWFPGMALSQRRKSIDSLHAAAAERLGVSKVLEVSRRSRDELGVALSAFNLSFTTVRQQRILTVESAFQGSKVFDGGGPFPDLFDGPSGAAKKDPRLTTSGRLVGFRFFGSDWGLEPRTAFYDWLYLNALMKNPQLVDELPDWSAFTDIEFNPKRSLNCQAYSVALFVALRHRGLLESALSSQESFLRVLRDVCDDNARQDDTRQARLGLKRTPRASTA